VGPKTATTGRPTGSGDMHGAGIVADEKMACESRAGSIGDRGFSGEVDGGCRIPAAMAFETADSAAVSEQDHVGIVLCLKTTCELGESRGGQHFAEP